VIWLIVGAIVAIAAALIVALPFLREPVAVDDDLGSVSAESDRRLALLEERDRALGALKELEFDHSTGKIDDTDYRRLVGPLRRAAANALQELDRLRDAG
jgi:uncharacterized membrane protein YdfJ with MMPL/SSD domain